LFIELSNLSIFNCLLPLYPTLQLFEQKGAGGIRKPTLVGL